MSHSSDSECDEPIRVDELEEADFNAGQDDDGNEDVDDVVDGSDDAEPEGEPTPEGQEWSPPGTVAEHRGSIDELHRLKQWYAQHKVQDDQEDEDAYLQHLNAEASNELQSLREVTEVLRGLEEMKESQPKEQVEVVKGGGRVRPQRRVAGSSFQRIEHALEVDEEEAGFSEVIEESELEQVLGGVQEIKRHVRMSREVQRLLFSNPGTAFADQFNVTRSSRSQRRSTNSKAEDISSPQKRRPRQPKSVESPTKRRGPLLTYDSAGHLHYKEQFVADQCDCLRSDCGGCFFPCRKCGSNRCGPLCRSSRSALAFSVADMSNALRTNVIRLNPFRKLPNRST